MQTFEYNGYLGSIEFDTRSDCLHGNLLHITDLITYEADTMPALRKAFEESVDDYLATCKEFGIEPKKPYKGVFNVRMKPELHQKAAMKASQLGTSLNDLVNNAVENFVENKPSKANFDYETLRIKMFEPIERLKEEIHAQLKPTNPVNKIDVIAEAQRITFIANEPALMQ
ncbi:MAG TPA: type II toxin-antitoxin system HicB family antitoxin [Methylophilus sp.]|uniref:type II toxin-antitoxin system HicB family antitoxin n=1 Tax=Methylophilus sp. TaxID=29541 RepID=UPI002B89D864|nr:type II toxin-antitoxin system HicB family antitoxin [Methylophilus sp.]HSH86865.1 type II toxin-antitoxin system HicB family antitoxin [Methylophilus sp.]